MTTNTPPEKGTETSVYDKAIEIVAEIPDWDKRPQIRDAVQQLMMIDSMQSIVDRIDDDDEDLPKFSELDEYKKQCGISPWESQQKQKMLLQLLENEKKRAAHETVSPKTYFEQALEIVKILPTGWEKLTPLYNAFYRLMMMDGSEPLAEASNRDSPSYDSKAGSRYHDQFDIWPDERHAEQKSLLKTIGNIAREFELIAKQQGKKMPGDDQSEGNGDSGFDSPRFGPSLN